MINKLHDYIQNPDNTDVNFDLGFVYENQGQTAAAAVSYRHLTLPTKRIV